MSNVSTPRSLSPAPSNHSRRENEAADRLDEKAAQKQAHGIAVLEQRETYRRARNDGASKKKANAQAIDAANARRNNELDAMGMQPNDVMEQSLLARWFAPCVVGPSNTRYIKRAEEQAWQPHELAMGVHPQREQSLDNNPSVQHPGNNPLEQRPAVDSQVEQQRPVNNPPEQQLPVNNPPEQRPAINNRPAQQPANAAPMLPPPRPLLLNYGNKTPFGWRAGEAVRDPAAGDFMNARKNFRKAVSTPSKALVALGIGLTGVGGLLMMPFTFWSIEDICKNTKEPKPTGCRCARAAAAGATLICIAGILTGISLWVSDRVKKRRSRIYRLYNMGAGQV